MLSSQTYQHMWRELKNSNKYSSAKTFLILIQVIKVHRRSSIGRKKNLPIYSRAGYKCYKTGSYHHLLDRLERGKQAFSLILRVETWPKTLRWKRGENISNCKSGWMISSRNKMTTTKQNKNVHLLSISSTTTQVNPLFEKEQLKLYSCPFLSLRSSKSDPWDLPPTLATSVPGRPHNTGTASRKCRAPRPLALLVFRTGKRHGL